MHLNVIISSHKTLIFFFTILVYKLYMSIVDITRIRVLLSPSTIDPILLYLLSTHTKGTLIASKLTIDSP